MRDKIHLYELQCFWMATEEQREKVRARTDKAYILEDLPSKEIRSLMEEFIWHRGKVLAPSSMASELIYYNNIRDFLIEKQIEELHPEDEEEILHLLKRWMMEKGYKLSSEKYRREYAQVKVETPAMILYMKKVLEFAAQDMEDEQARDIWRLEKLNFPMRINPIKEAKKLNFKKISQLVIRDETKKAVYVQLKYEALGSIQTEITAINRFSAYLKNKQSKIESLLELEREDIEKYLIYLQTEATERKNYRSDLYSLRRLIEEVGKIYECENLQNLFLNNDFPGTPKYNFQFRTDEEIRRFNSGLLRADEQIGRIMFIHELLGTRISDTLILKTDCLRKKQGRYFVRIDQVKARSYEKAISDEVGHLIERAIEYTKERYGKTRYIFVRPDDPGKPYVYSTLRSKVVKIIKQEDIRDDYGELMKFGTHIFRHTYGKKLTEMHVEDWMIAKLLGHKTMQSVHHYRRIGNRMMADETRKTRENMDLILMNVIKGWDGYEI